MSTAKDRLAVLVQQDTDSCIIWPEGQTKSGYGKLRYNGKAWRAHRAAYHLVHGDVPDLLRHTCDTRLCCNTRHLVHGTQCDNMHDAMGRGRMPGTPLSAADVEYIRNSDLRQCDLALKFKVNPSHISRIMRGEARLYE